MFLRQSTIQSIRFGPFLDATNGVDEEVALTITQALRRLSKDGGDFAQSSETGNSTHDEDGWYFDDLTAADTGTVGELILAVADPATHLPVWTRWWVIEEAVYDAMYGAAATGPLQATTGGNTLDVNATGEVALDFGATIGTLDEAQFGADFLTSAKIADNAFLAVNFNANSLDGKGNWNINKTGYSLTQTFPSNFASTVITAGGVVDADVTAINGSTTAAVQLALSANEIESGLVEDTPSATTTVIKTDLAETQDDIYIGRTVIFTSGNARGEATEITDYTGASGTLTVTALANAPTLNDTFIIL